tara:strand:- start:2610 stop:3422 length:813 start_codon:yes stop_codon:yes gene_type:complete
MRVLSIDIGIKNMAYIILEHNENSDNFEIIKWDIMNLCKIIPNCSNIKCNCKAKFSKNNTFFCKKHTKNEEYKIPVINTKTLVKQNIKNLLVIIEENNITYEKEKNKNEIIKTIEDHVSNTCFDIIEDVNANNVKLIDLGINLKNECNKLFETIDLHSIDIILLENQISPIANRMKTIQGMIAQYFIDNGNYNIEFISSANKLKLFLNNEKTTYSERKKKGILITKELLEKKNKLNDGLFFSKHSKKDDLADSFLQCIYYLVTFNKLKLN